MNEDRKRQVETLRSLVRNEGGVVSIVAGAPLCPKCQARPCGWRMSTCGECDTRPSANGVTVDELPDRSLLTLTPADQLALDRDERKKRERDRR